METETGVVAADSPNPFRDYSRWLRCLVAPFLGLVGVLGNALNTCVLGWRCRQSKLDMLERGAMIGLISLAASDLLFCLSVVPHAFYPENKMKFDRCLFQCMFQMYGLYVHDLSVKISTWVTVLIAVARYVVVCHPLRARLVVCTRSTKICLVLIHIFWALFLLPILWTYKSMTVDWNNFNSTVYDEGDNSTYSMFDWETEETFVYIDTGEFSKKQVLRQAFLYSWVVIGYFIPLLVLIFSNVYLIRALRNSATIRERQLTVGNDVRRHVHMRQANSTITRTLILLIVFFIVLVSPSQIVGFYNSVSGDHILESVDRLHKMEFLLTLSNVLVTANFASHFFLYCTVSSSFRRTLVSMLRSLLGRVLSLRVCCTSSHVCQARRRIGSEDVLKLDRMNPTRSTSGFEANRSPRTNVSKPKEGICISGSHLVPRPPVEQNLQCHVHRNSMTLTSTLPNDASAASDSRPTSVIVE